MNHSDPVIPEGFNRIDVPEGVILQRKWCTMQIIFLAIFAVVWDSFLFFFYTQILNGKHPSLISILFPLGHVAVGVGITYYVIASFFNKTEIIIRADSVQVKHGPIPWRGNIEVKRADMTDFIVRERTRNRNQTTYTLMYVDSQRREKKLISGLPLPEQAEFIEAMIRLHRPEATSVLSAVDEHVA